MLVDYFLVEYHNIFIQPIKRAVRKFVRTYVFPAWKIQKAIDMSPSGGLNYAATDALREIEDLQK